MVYSVPMKLFIIRHADPTPATGAGDEYRSLSDEGAAKVLRLASCCNALGISIDKVWSSNLLRAEETAERLAHHLNGTPPVLFNENLIPPGDFNGIRADLRGAGQKSIALVGHMPFLGECLQYWIGGNAHPGIHLEPCSLIALDAKGINRQEMRLEFVINDFIAGRVVNGLGT